MSRGTERKDKIKEVIFQAIDNVNALLDEDGKIEKSLNADLLSQSTKLDSLGLVNLILAIEEIIQDDFGVAVTLASSMAMSSSSSPFRSIQILIDHIDTILGGASHE